MSAVSPGWQKALKRLDGAYAAATIKSYEVDIAIFVGWCEERTLEPFPAPVETVCAFLEDQALDLRPLTVRRRLYAIRKIHRLLGLADPTHDEEINLALRRVRRAKPNRPRQAKGLTSALLQKCLAAQPDDPWGLRNRALISLGYDLLARRSEIAALCSGDIEETAQGVLRILVRRSKADPFGMGRVAFSSPRSAELVQAWLDWRGPRIEPLFCGIYHGRPINRALSGTTVRDILKGALLAAGLPPEEVRAFSGHSMRVGAAQDLLCAGHETAAIMRAGGWKSINVLGRYLELAEHSVWT